MYLAPSGAVKGGAVQRVLVALVHAIRAPVAEQIGIHALHARAPGALDLAQGRAVKRRAERGVLVAAVRAVAVPVAKAIAPHALRAAGALHLHPYGTPQAYRPPSQHKVPVCRSKWPKIVLYCTVLYYSRSAVAQNNTVQYSTHVMG